MFIDLSKPIDFESFKHTQEFEKLVDAANEGDTSAMFACGMIQLNGYNTGVAPNLKDPLEFFKAGADANDPLCTAAYCYYFLINNKKSLQAATFVNTKFMRHVASLREDANQGHIYAMIYYAKALDLGIGLKRRSQADIVRDRAIITRYLLKASESGDAEAHYQLGVLCDQGPPFFKQRDRDKAIFHLKIAAKKGHVESQHSLASRYYAQENYGEAKYWYQQASKQNSAFADYQLGIIYLEHEKPINPIKAFAHLKRAAENGNISAKFLAADMQIVGDGVEENVAEGIVNLLSLLREQGDELSKIGKRDLVTRRVEEVFREMALEVAPGTEAGTYNMRFSGGSSLDGFDDDYLRANPALRHAVTRLQNKK